MLPPSRVPKRPHAPPSNPLNVPANISAFLAVTTMYMWFWHPLFALGLPVASMVFGVMGLVRAKGRTGRVPAIIGIVLSAIPLAMFVGMSLDPDTTAH